MNAKFAVNERVWVKPLARYAQVKKVVEKRGTFFYRFEHRQVDQFSETFLESQQEHEAREHLRQAQTLQADRERALRRLAIVFSEPLECAFKRHVDYRRAYVDWAKSFGHPDDMPVWVRPRYFRYLLMPEGIA